MADVAAWITIGIFNIILGIVAIRMTFRASEIVEYIEAGVVGAAMVIILGLLLSTFTDVINNLKGTDEQTENKSKLEIISETEDEIVVRLKDGTKITVEE